MPKCPSIYAAVTDPVLRGEFAHSLFRKCGRPRLRSVLHPMQQLTHETPLLGLHRQRASRWYILPYAFLLFVCILSQFAPLTPSWVLEAIFSDAAGVQLYLLVLPDYIQSIVWPYLRRVLDYIAFEALHDHPSFSVRKLVRKSDCLSSILKGLLKGPSTFVTITVALRLIGISTWLSPILALLFLALMGGIAFISVDWVKMIQTRKSERDDAV